MKHFVRFLSASLFLVSVLAFTSCDEDRPVVDDKLLGTWELYKLSDARDDKDVDYKYIVTFDKRHKFVIESDYSENGEGKYWAYNDASYAVTGETDERVIKLHDNPKSDYIKIQYPSGNVKWLEYWITENGDLKIVNAAIKPGDSKRFYRRVK